MTVLIIAALRRSDFFPGLGWMLTRELWMEFEPKWPEGYWDDWVRDPAQRKGRVCITLRTNKTLRSWWTGQCVYCSDLVLGSIASFQKSPGHILMERKDHRGVSFSMSISSTLHLTTARRSSRTEMCCSAFVRYIKQRSSNV